MILDSSEEVLPEACWNGRKEAASKDHCSEPRNTAPKFPNDNLSSAIPLPRHTHIQLLKARAMPTVLVNHESNDRDEASTNWRPLRPILIRDEVKTSYTRRPLKPILYNRNVKR